MKQMKEDADRNDYCTCNWSCLAGSVDEADEGGCRSERLLRLLLVLFGRFV